MNTYTVAPAGVHGVVFADRSERGLDRAPRKIVANHVHTDLLVGGPPPLDRRADALNRARIAVGVPFREAGDDLGALRRRVLQPLSLGAREHRLAFVVED